MDELIELMRRDAQQKQINYQNYLSGMGGLPNEQPTLKTDLGFNVKITDIEFEEIKKEHK